jgi:dihydrolipoamide dehydrogenase
MPTHELLVIGGGPGGYVAAIRAAQLGMNGGIVERESRMGGTCLRVGCIPSKALLESSHKLEMARHDLGRHGVSVTGVSFDLAAMLKRKDEIVATLGKGIDALLAKNKITRYAGIGRLAGPGRATVEAADGVVTTIDSPKIVLAVGSRSIVLPGVDVDGRFVGTSTEALAFDAVPGHLVVIGGGYIGLELGTVWRRLGARVTVLEYGDRILAGIDADIAAEALGLFRKQGLDIRLGARVTRARTDGNGAVVECAGLEPIRCDRVLAATGRRPATDGVGLETVGIAADQRGFIPVDGQFRTSASGVWAIGDCVPGPMLAHKAEEDGVACVEGIAGKWAHVDYDLVPAVVFTHPEIAAVGRTEEQLVAAGVAYKKGVFPFRANGRARTIDETTGKVKVLADTATDRVLGIHVIGPNAGDLIGEAAAAMTFGATAEDIARVCHAHPTLPEALKEAALAVSGAAIHG